MGSSPVAVTWCNNVSSSVGHEIDSFTSSAGYKQLINKPTHIVNNTFSCIDLIFCNNQNLISGYGFGLSIFEKCHHNTIFGKIKIHIPLPPSYVREVWNYSKANIKNIQAVLMFDWKKALENLSGDEKVNLLNETLLNILQNHISNIKIKFNHC